MKRSGADAYVSKPYKEWEIFSALSHVLGLRYTYADEERVEPSTALKPVSLSPEVVASLPEDLVIALGTALEEGDMERFMNLVGEVDKVALDAAERLRSLAENYDYEGLSKILKRGD
jgi:hypothetical protein